MWTFSSGGRYGSPVFLPFLPYRKRQYRAVFETTRHNIDHRTRKWIVNKLIIFWHICRITLQRRFVFCPTWHPLHLQHSLRLLTMLEKMRRRTSDWITKIGRSLRWFRRSCSLRFEATIYSHVSLHVYANPLSEVCSAVPVHVWSDGGAWWHSHHCCKRPQRLPKTYPLITCT